MSVEAFALDLKTPLRTASGTIDRREGFLVRERGGVGEATPLPGWTERRDACRNALERPENTLPSVDTPAARHGVALARADGRAREGTRRLAAELRGVERERVPVNATLGDGTPEKTADRAAGALDAGFDCLKVKVGARPLDADCERLCALRDVAPDVSLRLDANAAYDSETARDALARFADFDPEYVEQPVEPDEMAGLDAPVPLAADESLIDRSPDAVLDEGVDVLVLKPMVLGGPDRALAAAERAAERDAAAVVTTTVDGVVARLGALHVAATIEGPACGLATADSLASDLGPDPAPVRDGAMDLPGGSGIGIDPAEVGADA